MPGCWDFCGVLQETQNCEGTQNRFLFPLVLPPPWPQLFDQPPLPNRLPRSQFLSDLDLVSCKIYLPPLTNALGTSKYFSFCGQFRGGGDAPTAIRRCPARSSGTVDILCHLPSPKRTRIDFGRGDLVWGWQRNKIEVLFVLWSISRGRRRDDGDSQVIDAFVMGGR